MRASVFIATSLDGFIARANGDLDWLPGADGTPLAEDHGYNAFLASVDVVVIGRGTYEKVLSFAEWPYGSMAVRVLSSRPVEFPASLPPSVRAMSGPPAEVVAELSRQGFRHAYVDGGRTIQGFLSAGLVQKLILTRVPILLGQGIPLFGALARDIPLRHVRTRALAGGLVQSEYDIGG